MVSNLHAYINVMLLLYSGIMVFMNITGDYKSDQQFLNVNRQKGKKGIFLPLKLDIYQFQHSDPQGPWSNFESGGGALLVTQFWEGAQDTFS